MKTFLIWLYLILPFFEVKGSLGLFDLEFKFESKDGSICLSKCSLGSEVSSILGSKRKFGLAFDLKLFRLFERKSYRKSGFIFDFGSKRVLESDRESESKFELDSKFDDNDSGRSFILLFWKLLSKCLSAEAFGSKEVIGFVVVVVLVVVVVVVVIVVVIGVGIGLVTKSLSSGTSTWFRTWMSPESARISICLMAAWLLIKSAPSINNNKKKNRLKLESR